MDVGLSPGRVGSGIDGDAITGAEASACSDSNVGPLDAARGWYSGEVNRKTLDIRRIGSTQSRQLARHPRDRLRRTVLVHCKSRDPELAIGWLVMRSRGHAVHRTWSTPRCASSPRDGDRATPGRGTGGGLCRRHNQRWNGCSAFSCQSGGGGSPRKLRGAAISVALRRWVRSALYSGGFCRYHDVRAVALAGSCRAHHEGGDGAACAADSTQRARARPKRWRTKSARTRQSGGGRCSADALSFGDGRWS